MKCQMCKTSSASARPFSQIKWMLRDSICYMPRPTSKSALALLATLQMVTVDYIHLAERIRNVT